MTEYYSRKQLAERFGVCPLTITNWEKRHGLKRIELSKRTIRYPVQEVQRLERELSFTAEPFKPTR